MPPLSDIEKAAVLLIALGKERARPILDRLGPDELMPLIDAMRRMRGVDADTRRRVLEEVAEMLERRASGATAGPVNLLTRLGPYLPERIDPKRIDWNRAGFDFGPSDDDPPPPPGGRR